MIQWRSESGDDTSGPEPPPLHGTEFNFWFLPILMISSTAAMFVHRRYSRHVRGYECAVLLRIRHPNRYIYKQNNIMRHWGDLEWVSYRFEHVHYRRSTHIYGKINRNDIDVAHNDFRLRRRCYHCRRVVIHSRGSIHKNYYYTYVKLFFFFFNNWINYYYYIHENKRFIRFLVITHIIIII